ncbi:MAG: sodium-translocating pyrophosphatase [Spirochaetaceae bacterium]|nr:MAG: sodium-translocating pyrophosphatase [Spirochaetaceae bacterium]
MNATAIIGFVFSAAVIGLLFVVFLIRRIMLNDEGNDSVREITGAIRSGARVFLQREYRILAIFTVLMVIVLSLLVEPRPWSGVAYLFGTIMSALAGFIGMAIATRANGRTTVAAARNWHEGLKVAFSAGGVMGFSVVSLGLLGVALTVFVTGNHYLALSFAFGSSAVALFLRVGGGIFTKCADVGADLVGKVEHSIPEDDPRNAAVIADNVGDNVGDIAGMGSDLYESYVSSIAAAIVLGVAALGARDGVLLPLALAAAGILVSMVGALLVRPKHREDNFEQQVEGAQKSMNFGVFAANGIMIVVSFFIVRWMMGSLEVFWALLVGMFAGVGISATTEYYTSAAYKPTQNIARASTGGPALTIMQGFALSMISIVPPVIMIVVASLVAYAATGLLGIAMAALGLLVNLGVTLSMDCYGPISDNAAGIAEMAGLDHRVRERCEALDAVGNTTAALGKGFSIGSAALASLAWIATYFETAGIEVANLMYIEVMAGTLIGGMLPFLFSALAIGGVGRGAGDVVEEVRRQFREIPGLMEGNARPDYERCVDIATKRALREMIIPGMLVILVPLALGYTLGPKAVAGLLVGALITGFMLATMMSNAGGAWDNAKKFVESGEVGGKNSEAHRATVVGDTVGDPFKDTAGPSLNILVKLVGKVAVIFAAGFTALIVF